MWLSVISTLCCFAIAVMLFTPLSRPFVFYQPMALFFLFEGVWSLVNGFMKLTGNYYEFMMWVQYIAIFVLFCAMLGMAFANYRKNTKASSKADTVDANYKADPDCNMPLTADDVTDKQQNNEKD